MSPGMGWFLTAAALPLLGACGSEGKDRSGETAAAQVGAPLERDPCSLLTREEAEAVLGPLGRDPYRTRQDTTVADPAGPSCAWSTADGRALILTPEWTYGKMNLNAERMIGGLVKQVADLPGLEADTLEGTWDDAVVAMTGELLLLKGPRSLTINYLGSSTDAAGAIRLSGPALERLAAAPEAPRAKANTDECPLPAELVSAIIGEPVRVAPTPVTLMDACSYQLVSDPTVEVELSIKPDAVAGSVFEGLHSRARALLGASARPDTIEVGEGGNAYGATSASEAAVRAGGKVYHAHMADLLGGAASNKKEAMVRLVAGMMESHEAAP